jgi:hypothetical protein
MRRDWQQNGKRYRQGRKSGLKKGVHARYINTALAVSLGGNLVGDIVAVSVQTLLFFDLVGHDQCRCRDLAIFVACNGVNGSRGEEEASEVPGTHMTKKKYRETVEQVIRKTRVIRTGSQWDG